VRKIRIVGGCSSRGKGEENVNSKLLINILYFQRV
jgi:hypothetical protein